ncbi:hypothetical protein LXL04_031744 [Taraxacum kok-saghyz]
MATRLHFFTLVLLLLTTLIGFTPQTNAARLPKQMIKDLEKTNRVSKNGVPFRSMKRSGSMPLLLSEKDAIKKLGLRPDRLIHRGLKSSVPSTPQKGGQEDMRSNPNPRVMGHGTYRIWRSQPSGMGEEENMEGREVVIPKERRRHP